MKGTMNRFLAGLLAAGLALAALPAAANEAAIRKALEGKLEGSRIEGIQPAPVAGLWEVRYRSPEGVKILYSDAAGRYVLQGRIFELATDRDLTEERSRKLNAVRFDSLPLDLAVKVQRGNGKRVLAVFSDPYCPACRSFERVLAQVDDITIHYFMYPVIRPENASHSRAVWCSPDRAKAWLELAAGAQPKVPAASPNCANPVDKVLAAGRRLRINATPTLILANGERISGGLAADDLTALLDQAR
jgi:thiol:disulfide interchange protein DsbC